MKKDLVKLALAGVAAGLCISAQSSKGSVIAMTKCSKTPTQQQGNSSCSSCSGSKENPQEAEPSSCSTSKKSGACGSGDSCPNSCNGQGDQSSQNEKIREGRKVEARRLGAAKTATEK